VVIPTQLWTYRANIESVYDADTLHLLVDEGFSQYTRQRVRLARINAPELATPAGKVARDFVVAWVGTPGPWAFIITSHKQDNYGRYLVELWRVIDGTNLSDALLASGNAVPYP